MVDLAPSPMATIAITAPTPMIMPSIVRKERSLFRPRALSAILNVIHHMVSRLGCLVAIHRPVIRNDLTVFENDLSFGVGGDIRFMSDEHNRDVPLLLQPLEQGHDLLACRGV